MFNNQLKLPLKNPMHEYDVNLFSSEYHVNSLFNLAICMDRSILIAYKSVSCMGRRQC